MVSCDKEGWILFESQTKIKKILFMSFLLFRNNDVNYIPKIKIKYSLKFNKF